ncbi:MAG TPA: DUF3644 domain-containing protein [Caldisericia bacterium]|nr:DUF3644 domain-containing protein [Caldisericia bacterium]
MKKRKRRFGSIKNELIKKSREAALAAVQIFNNPIITFKSESYIVLMIIAWTYLLHAYYREKKVEYRYYNEDHKRRRFDITKRGAYKYWDLERCLNCKYTPIDKDTANNLRFLVGLRHEIEHQMTNRIDDLLSARFQACCLNFNDYIKKLFTDKLGIEKHLSFSLQFSSISTEQKDLLKDHQYLPANILAYIQDFDAKLTIEEYSSPQYAYRILFIPKTANRKGQADRTIEFIKSDSPLADSVNKKYAVIKEMEKDKFLPKQVVEIMKNKGYVNFSIHFHTELWKSLDAKNPSKGYGVLVANKTWYWHERWLDVVLDHCQKYKDNYS